MHSLQSYESSDGMSRYRQPRNKKKARHVAQTSLSQKSKRS